MLSSDGLLLLEWFFFYGNVYVRWKGVLQIYFCEGFARFVENLLRGLPQFIVKEVEFSFMCITNSIHAAWLTSNVMLIFRSCSFCEKIKEKNI